MYTYMYMQHVEKKVAEVHRELKYVQDPQCMYIYICTYMYIQQAEKEVAEAHRDLEYLLSKNRKQNRIQRTIQGKLTESEFQRRSAVLHQVKEKSLRDLRYICTIEKEN